MKFENLIIRDVKLTECTQLAEISRSTFYETFVDFNTKEDMEQYLAEHCTTEQMEVEMKEADTLFFFAEYENELVGFVKLKTNKILYQFNNSRAIEIERLYVQQTHQSKKIGAALMSYSIHYAKQQECNIIYLAVWEHNQKAIHFYEKWGYENFDTQIFILGKDKQNDILMKKNL